MNDPTKTEILLKELNDWTDKSEVAISYEVSIAIENLNSVKEYIQESIDNSLIDKFTYTDESD